MTGEGLSMPDPPEGAELSADGQSWWDGTQWVPIASNADGETDIPGVSALDTPIDWNDYPELVRATTYGADIDAYLTDIGVDPTVISDSGNA